MKHPFLKLALVAGAAALIYVSVKKSKEALKKAKEQAAADAEMAEEAAKEAETKTTEEIDAEEDGND